MLVCTWRGVQGVYPDGFDEATSSSADPKDSTARHSAGTGNIQGVVRFQERHSDNSPSGATVGVEWELTGLSHGKSYSWRPYAWRHDSHRRTECGRTLCRVQCEPCCSHCQPERLSKWRSGQQVWHCQCISPSLCSF